jgi:hypothetical protein
MLQFSRYDFNDNIGIDWTNHAVAQALPTESEEESEEEFEEDPWLTESEPDRHDVSDNIENEVEKARSAIQTRLEYNRMLRLQPKASAFLDLCGVLPEISEKIIEQLTFIDSNTVRHLAGQIDRSDM